MVDDTKVETVASRLREISDSVHDEDKCKEYIDELYADLHYQLKRIAESGGYNAEIPQSYFWDKLKAINPMISASIFHRVEDKIWTLLRNDGFIIEEDFNSYCIRW